MNIKKQKKFIIVGALVVFLVVAVMARREQQSDPYIAPAKSAVLAGQKAIVYKSPTCGCCGVYAKYLEKNGVKVEIRDLADLSDIKTQYEVPESQTSCHTTIIDGYVVEGHIPAEAIEKLLTERPDVKGIAMGGMPVGSPGMPGKQTESFEIFSFESATSTELFLSI